MESLLKLIKAFLLFFGSIPFTLLVLGSLALTVIYATFLESSSSSHLFAARHVYDHPWMQWLLLAIFINILFATIKKYPFQLRQIPFLITHLGLLMIISGVFIKQHFGVQGRLLLQEGGASSKLLLDHSYSLLLERRIGIDPRDHQSYRIPINPWEPLPEGEWRVGELLLTPLSVAPHSSVHYRGWIQEDTLQIDGLPPIAVESEYLNGKSSLSQAAEMEGWRVAALSLDSFDDLAEIAQEVDQPLLLFCVDTQGALKIVTFEERSVSSHYSSLSDEEIPNSLVVYDGGFGGYALQCYVPSYWAQQAQQNASLWIEAEEYPKAHDWMAELLLRFKRSELPQEQLWCWLVKERWPLSMNLMTAASCPEELMEQLALQLVHLEEQLPDLPAESDRDHLFCLETPLQIDVQEAAPQDQYEKNRPALSLLCKRGSMQEALLLPFDPMSKSVYQTLFGGLYRVRFEPMVRTLPYEVRLRRAERVCYGGSLQPYAYSCWVSILDRKSGGEEKAYLSLNQVYETWDGFRFYLANVEGDEMRAKRVALVVNYDPAKRLLTYPGGFLVALGIMGLASQKFRFRRLVNT